MILFERLSFNTNVWLHIDRIIKPGLKEYDHTLLACCNVLKFDNCYFILQSEPGIFEYQEQLDTKHFRVFLVI